ncbi:choice-of-anchor Q domain-containing protein [Salinimicrobium flavum]|uniref:Choice-of-anchor Q domain-containing protein n=1 Tax=Salinimicrobium flavum TaxID=1737065 RepID=A0ABW5ITJ0_9FLAO
MRFLYTVFLMLILVLWSSCRSDFESVESTGKLEFSRDTVYLDTIFSNISSATYSLKVYNRSNEDIHIPNVALGKGEDSRYRLNVDGLAGSSFNDIEIQARDSIYIFIEATVDLQDQQENTFLYTDVLEFRSSAHIQEVPVVTLVKDAVFLFPTKDSEGNIGTIPTGKDENGEDLQVQGFWLSDDQLTFTNEKAYVIYGYAAVPSGKNLTIEPGARIYFHSNSGLIISENATLQVKGTFSNDREKLENEVIFQGDLLEAERQDTPGQWGTIWFRSGSTDNIMNFTTIKNAGIGVLVEGNPGALSPTLHVKNTQIYNSSITGLRAENAKILGENLVVNNSGQASLHLSSGGNYEFRHCTFVNYWSGSFREFPSIFIEDISGSANAGDYFRLRISNSIIYGNENRELLFDLRDNSNISAVFLNSLIKFKDEGNIFSEDPLYDFSNESIYPNLILNEDPTFRNPLKNDLRLQAGSPAIDKGDPATATQVPEDLLNISRTGAPDIGAYEWVAPEENQE